MNTSSILSLAISVVAVVISVFAFMNRDPLPEPITGDAPQSVARDYIERPRWDGTDFFIDQHRPELIANLEINNFLQNDGLGLAFVRTSASGKNFQFCLWMFKVDSGWQFVNYMSPYLSGDAFRGKWVQKHEGWLEEMESKKDKWIAKSDGVW